MASVELSNIDLHGKPAIMFINTNYTTQEISSTNIFSNTSIQNINTYSTKLVPYIEIYQIDQSVNASLKNNSNFENSEWIPIEQNVFEKVKENLNRSEFEITFQVIIKTPYFQNNLLKTDISWHNHTSCTNKQNSSLGNKKFQIYIYSLKCINELPIQKFQVEYCVAAFENLQFECVYFVEIKDIETKQVKIYKLLLHKNDFNIKTKILYKLYKEHKLLYIVNYLKNLIYKSLSEACFCL